MSDHTRQVRHGRTSHVIKRRCRHPPSAPTRTVSAWKMLCMDISDFITTMKNMSHFLRCELFDKYRGGRSFTFSSCNTSSVFPIKTLMGILARKNMANSHPFKKRQARILPSIPVADEISGSILAARIRGGHTVCSPHRGQCRECIHEPSAGTQNSERPARSRQNTSLQRQPAKLWRPELCVSADKSRFVVVLHV